LGIAQLGIGTCWELLCIEGAKKRQGQRSIMRFPLIRSPRDEPIDASATACDGHHKMSDFGAASEPVHSGGEGHESV
jgi:hypothetical protein